MPDYLKNLFEQVATAPDHATAFSLCKDILSGGYEQCIKNQFAQMLGMLARAEADKP